MALLVVGGGGFATIQDAVDAASDGDVISITAGLYTEQVVINGFNGLTITTTGPVMVEAPTGGTLAQTGTDPQNSKAVHAIFTVIDSTGVTIENLAVDGNEMGNQIASSGGGFEGIAYINSTGTISGVNIDEVRDPLLDPTTLAGTQRGNAILVTNDDAITGNTVTIENSSLLGFQKTGMVIRNADATVSGNVITGFGTQSVIAQNGIQLSVGSTGTIDGNTISGFGFSGTGGWWDFNIGVFGGTGVVITNNDITGDNNQTWGVVLFGASGATIAGNSLSDLGSGTSDYNNAGALNVIDTTTASANAYSGNTWNLDYDPNGASSLPHSIDGTAGNDWMGGDALADNLRGHAGNDYMLGRAGDDIIDGGDGRDTINGGDGDDTVTGGGGDDWLIYSETAAQQGGTDSLDGGSDDVFGDTVDFSQLGYAVWVDLTYTGTDNEAWTNDLSSPNSGGTWREIADLTGIENIVGTGSDDWLSGNARDNDFKYTGGRDLYDGRGEDFLGDTVDFSEFASAVWVDLEYTGTNYEAWTNDMTNLNSGGTWREIADLTDIENIVGTGSDDWLWGDAGDNSFGYTGGRDTFDGRGDNLSGGGYGDTADFSAFDSAVWVDLEYTGTDYEAWTNDLGNINAGGTWREIADLTNIENIAGTNSSDGLWGDAGDNILIYVGGRGQTGNIDTFDGRAGSDTAVFTFFDAAVWVDLEYTGSSNEAWTRDGNDLSTGAWREIADLTNIENIMGSVFDDTLVGDAGDNGLNGQDGNDILEGRAGVDMFLFEDAWGNDTIVDFANDGFEKMDMSGTGLAFGDLTISDAGNDTLVSDGTNSILLTGIADHTTIDADDFIF